MGNLRFRHNLYLLFVAFFSSITSKLACFVFIQIFSPRHVTVFGSISRQFDPLRKIHRVRLSSPSPHLLPMRCPFPRTLAFITRCHVCTGRSRGCYAAEATRRWQCRTEPSRPKPSVGRGISDNNQSVVKRGNPCLGHPGLRSLQGRVGNWVLNGS